MQRPTVHGLCNRRQRQLQNTRLYIQSAVHGMQGARARCCTTWWGARGRQARARGGRQALHFPLPWRVRLLWICPWPRPRERQANKQTIKCHGPTQHTLSSFTAGRLPDVSGLDPQWAVGEEAERRSGHRGRQPGHPPQLQGGVPARGGAKHKDTERIRTLMPFNMLLSNFCFWGAVLIGRSPNLLFCFWYRNFVVMLPAQYFNISWQGGLAPKDLETWLLS